jgi:hypothetical protein
MLHIDNQTGYIVIKLAAFERKNDTVWPEHWEYNSNIAESYIGLILPLFSEYLGISSEC